MNSPYPVDPVDPVRISPLPIQSSEEPSWSIRCNQVSVRLSVGPKGTMKCGSPPVATMLYQRSGGQASTFERYPHVRCLKGGIDMSNPRIKILACGGTIDKVYFDAKSDYEVGEPQILTILRESNVSISYHIESIVRKDSLEMNDKDRDQIHRAVVASDSNHILITHGTDTMIETAKHLDDVPDRTIVLTGSMEPARFRDTDAVFNIGCAIAAVQTLLPGVYIVMNGRVFDPYRTRKNVVDGVFEECG